MDATLFAYEQKSADFNVQVSYHYSVSANSGVVIASLPAASTVVAGAEVRAVGRVMVGAI